MKRALLGLAFALAFAMPAQAATSPIVADISTYRIAIDAGFTGIRLFIFGARNESGDVAVVIRGPEKEVTVRKKERIGGMWINRRSMDFDKVPNFYAVAASRPLNEFHADALLARLGIGSGSLLSAPADSYDKARYPEFSKAFLDNQAAHRLYDESQPVNFMGEMLFKTVIPFPDNIPKGDYTAEIYLISDGELAGMQSLPIRVEKSGFDAILYDMAHKYSLSYGLLAVLLALAAGWAAGRMFQKP